MPMNEKIVKGRKVFTPLSPSLSTPSTSQCVYGIDPGLRLSPPTKSRTCTLRKEVEGRDRERKRKKTGKGEWREKEGEEEGGSTRLKIKINN